MKILVACEESQAVTKELRKLGHEAYSCDIQECSGGHPEWHCQEDVIPLLNGNCSFKTMDGTEHKIQWKWDMIIAFPPCTHLAVSGAAWFEKKRKDGRQREAIEFFMTIMNADCEKIAVENPVNIISGDYIGKHFHDLQEKYNFPIKPTQSIQPYEYGDEAKKKTCLWLKGLSELHPTNIVNPGEFYISPNGKKYSKGSSSDMAIDENGKIIPWNDPRTAKIRSKTFPGIAKAMAEQWAGNANKKEREEKQMELKMNDYQLPEQIQFNYEELKKELSDKVSVYETMVYTDEQIQEAKKDKANLNKLKKALNDERIRQEREYMKPFNVFKSQINEIISIIDKPVAVIDRQVKEFDEKKRQDKMDSIKEYWNGLEVPEGLALEEIFDQKWLNASTSMKSIQDSIAASIEKFKTDMESLSNLPEFSFEAQQVYISTLDVGKALNEAHRLSEMAKKKAEHEEAMKKIAEEQNSKEIVKMPDGGVYIQDDDKQGFTYHEPVVSKQWVRFQALMTTEQALALKQFFESRNIEFKPI